jgi:hypothetical protein
MGTESGHQAQLKSTNSSDTRADVLGVLYLLLSAKASIQNFCSDEVCGKILDRCISDLGKRYVLSASDISSRTFWADLSLAALLRLLEYIRGEVTESLSDAASAELVGQCIAHLMECNRVPAKHLYAPGLITAH